MTNQFIRSPDSWTFCCLAASIAFSVLFVDLTPFLVNFPRSWLEWVRFKRFCVYLWQHKISASFCSRKISCAFSFFLPCTTSREETPETTQSLYQPGIFVSSRTLFHLCLEVGKDAVLGHQPCNFHYRSGLKLWSAIDRQTEGDLPSLQRSANLSNTNYWAFQCFSESGVFALADSNSTLPIASFLLNSGGPTCSGR